MTTNATPGPVEVELKPCPFCGGGAALIFSRFELHCGHHVVCHGKKDCPLYCSEPYRAFDSAVEAETAWNTRIEAARPVFEAGEEEAYQIGIAEGRQEMVREIDLATGGDGEFRFSTLPERNCPDDAAMKARVIERFEAARPVSGEPVGYIIADMLNRKSEFERNGIVMTAAPQGMSTLPLYAARPVQSELVEADRNERRVRIQQALLSTLGDTYDCTRVWEAWNVGTMDRDDFVPVLDRLEELVDEIDAAITKGTGEAP